MFCPAFGGPTPSNVLYSSLKDMVDCQGNQLIYNPQQTFANWVCQFGPVRARLMIMAAYKPPSEIQRWRKLEQSSEDVLRERQVTAVQGSDKGIVDTSGYAENPLRRTV